MRPPGGDPIIFWDPALAREYRQRAEQFDKERLQSFEGVGGGLFFLFFWVFLLGVLWVGGTGLQSTLHALATNAGGHTISFGVGTVVACLILGFTYFRFRGERRSRAAAMLAVASGVRAGLVAAYGADDWWPLKLLGIFFAIVSTADGFEKLVHVERAKFSEPEVRKFLVPTPL